jgi:hypothetical protein
MAIASAAFLLYRTFHTKNHRLTGDFSYLFLFLFFSLERHADMFEERESHFLIT